MLECLGLTWLAQIEPKTGYLIMDQVYNKIININLMMKGNASTRSVS